VREQKSPLATSAFSVIVRLAVRAGLGLLLFLGWSMTKAGKPMFDAGADLESWARERLENGR